MCVPCAKKKILDDETLRMWEEAEKTRIRVEMGVEMGLLDEKDAEKILRPLIDAEEGFHFKMKQALGLARERYARRVSKS